MFRINNLSKKQILASSVFMIFFYLISFYHKELNLPYDYQVFCCVDDRRFNFFSIFIPIFAFSLLYLKIKENNFKSWSEFSLIYLIAYVIIYFLSPTQGNGYMWFQRETISLFGSGIYVLISVFFVMKTNKA
jgi:hypothetical protein